MKTNWLDSDGIEYTIDFTFQPGKICYSDPYYTIDPVFEVNSIEAKIRKAKIPLTFLQFTPKELDEIQLHCENFYKVESFLDV